MARLVETSIQERTGASPLEHAPAELGTRKADEATVVRWVADNVDVAEPDPKTCPSPFAWTLLRECRERAGFLEVFLEKCWVKLIPPRSQLEVAGPKAQDGASTIALVDRILGHSKAAREPGRRTTASDPKED